MTISKAHTNRNQRVKLTYAVLDPITSLSQNIIFQVEQLEASEQILDKFTDLHRAVVITESDRVDC
jgi:hypothetical protein